MHSVNAELGDSCCSLGIGMLELRSWCRVWLNPTPREGCEVPPAFYW